MTGIVVTQGPGSYLGEIALMRNCPRSADVNAAPDGLTTYSISRSVFLEAITGVPQGLARTEAEIARRLS